MYEVDEVSRVGCYVRRVAQALNQEFKRKSRLFDPLASNIHSNLLHNQNSPCLAGAIPEMVSDDPGTKSASRPPADLYPA